MVLPTFNATRKFFPSLGIQNASRSAMQVDPLSTDSITVERGESSCQF